MHIVILAPNKERIDENHENMLSIGWQKGMA
jgi:hypothetical protein